MRLLPIVALAMALGACASGPPPPPPFVISLAPTPPETLAPPVLVPRLRVDDLRDVPDRTHIGEVYAPGGGTAPPVSGGVGAGPAAAVGVTAILLAPTQPTGRYLLVRDAADVVRAIEGTLTAAWLRSGRAPVPGVSIDATVRSFWIRPSWTTTCDIAVDVRLRDLNGAVRWQQSLGSHVDTFEGWFTTEAFERVARMALDQLAYRAAAAFASAGFGAAVDDRR